MYKNVSAYLLGSQQKLRAKHSDNMFKMVLESKMLTENIKMKNFLKDKKRLRHFLTHKSSESLLLLNLS